MAADASLERLVFELIERLYKLPKFVEVVFTLAAIMRRT